MRHIFNNIFGAALLVAFTMCNIYASRMYSPLLFRLVKFKEIEAGKQFLSHIQNEPFFFDQSNYLNTRFNNLLIREALVDDYNHNRAVQKLTAILKKNPKSRDALIRLALLMYKDQSYGQAYSYYLRAKNVDPRLSIKTLEGIKNKNL